MVENIMSDIEDSMIPQSKSIGEYLTIKKNQKFLIPSFQRAYSWGNEQCEKLLEDLFDYHENIDHEDSSYFFGNLITVEDKDTKSIQIIDGQQRTTTFLLLLKALHFLLNDFKSNENNLESNCINRIDRWLKEILMKMYKIDSDSISDYKITDFTNCFKQDTVLKDENLILESESMNEMDFAINDWNKILKSSRLAEVEPYQIQHKRKDNRYTNFFKNLKFFYNTIKKKLEEGNKNSFDQVKYLSQFIKTILEDCKVIQIASRNIDQAVAVFNSLNATGLPLSDADVICSSAYAKCKDEQTQKEFQKSWYCLIDNVENKLGSYFSVTTILQQFMYYQRFYKSANDGTNTDITTPGLRKYYTNDNKDFVGNPIPFCRNLNTLARLWEELLSYSIVRLALKTNNNIHLFLATFFYHFILQRNLKGKDSEIDVSLDYEKEIKPIVELFLRLFALLELVDISYSSSKFKVFLFQMGDEFAKLKNSCPLDDITERFNNQIFSIVVEFIGHLKEELHYYRDDRLVLLNEYLYTKYHNIDFYLDEDPNKINIEHIMPQSGNNVPSYMSNLSIDDYNDYLEKLGNKILLERKININLSDDPFKIKKVSEINGESKGRKHVDQGYRNSKYAIARALCKYKSNTWTSEDIDQATEKCVERIYRFIVEPLNTEQKAKLKSVEDQVN